MPLTLEQIVEEARHWPPEKVGELVGRLTEDLHTSDPDTEAAWKLRLTGASRKSKAARSKGFPVMKSRRGFGRRFCGETAFFRILFKTLRKKPAW